MNEFDESKFEMQVKFTVPLLVLGKLEDKPQKLQSKTRRSSHVDVLTSVCNTIAVSSPPVIYHSFLTFRFTICFVRSVELVIFMMLVFFVLILVFYDYYCSGWIRKEAWT